MKIKKAFSVKQLLNLPFYYKYFIRYQLERLDKIDRNIQKRKIKLKPLNKPISRIY